MDPYQILSAKRGEILALAERFGVKNLRIFGSVARREAGDRSDIDLPLGFPPGITLITHAASQRELSSLLGCPVDVVSLHGLSDRVRQKVIREAVLL